MFNSIGEESKAKIIKLSDSGASFYIQNNLERLCTIIRPDKFDKENRNCDFAVMFKDDIALILAELKNGEGESGVDQLISTAVNAKKTTKFKIKVGVLVCKSHTPPRRTTAIQIDDKIFYKLGFKYIRRKLNETLCIETVISGKLS